MLTSVKIVIDAVMPMTDTWRIHHANTIAIFIESSHSSTICLVPTYPYVVSMRYLKLQWLSVISEADYSLI